MIKIKKKSKLSKNILVAKKMPPLYHTLPNESFDINKSEVVEWLLDQESIKQYIFEQVRNHNPSIAPIIYDKETGRWQGVDFEK